MSSSVCEKAWPLFGGRRQIGHRAVERIAGDVVAEALRHQRQGVGRRQPALQPVELGLGLARRSSPMIGMTPGRIGTAVRLAAVLDDALLQVVVGGLGRRLVAVDHREDEIGSARRQLLSGRRATGLDDQRIAVRAALDVERPLTEKNRPL